MSGKKVKLQVWWHLRNPRDLKSFAVSYRPCDAETNLPLEHVPPAHLERVGEQLPQGLRERLAECVRQIQERFVPAAEPRNFGLGPVVPQQWLEAFSYLPQGAPGHERGDLFIAYRHHWPGFVEQEPHSRTARTEEVPKSLEAMLRTFTPFCEELAWRHYKERYRVPSEAIVSQEYHPPFVFVSFLDAYRTIAERLRDDLVNRDFAVFVDREAIAIGRRWRLELDEALNMMEFFVPLLAPGYGETGESQREYERARARSESGEVVILPVLVEGDPRAFPAFSETQMVLLHKPERRNDPMSWRQEIERLVGGIFGIAVPGLTG